MGKRSDFVRIDKDDYRTWDTRAVAPLVPHLREGLRYIEPCAGAGDLIDLLKGTRLGLQCRYASDIEPKRYDINRRDVLAVGGASWAAVADHHGADAFITNPPWSRPVLHALIPVLSNVRPTWLLFDAGWMQTAQAGAYLDRLVRIVAVGRVRWIRGTMNDAKDDCAWYLFDKADPQRVPYFHGRAA